MVERRLGRGLDFFLSSAAPSGATAEVLLLEAGSILRNPAQPRQEFPDKELQELAESIRANGILQPILVRKKGASYELVAGERRLRAAQLAGLERIPALVRDLTPESSAVAALVENIQRSDLSAIEKGRAFQKLLEATKGTQETLARQLGMDRSTVANLMRLLELPAEVQAAVSRGTITMGHARALLGPAQRRGAAQGGRGDPAQAAERCARWKR
jgi:ParB family chromosome partitioning protein